MPKTLNSLMKHLRENGININGSAQKRRLKNIGYYHGYKGYRFSGKASNRLPLTDFSQVAALHDFDMQLKALFYPRIMSIETALKNYTLEAVICDAGSSAFEDIWHKSLTDYRRYRIKEKTKYRKKWVLRQHLRSEIDKIIFNSNKRDVIGHFCDADKDIPIWALFEVMMLGNFGTFYRCLDNRVKSKIVHDLGIPLNQGYEFQLENIIFALKDMRNAIAHNGVVLDVRFQSGNINTGVSRLLERETGVNKIDFKDITDYVVLVVYLMRCMKLTKTECKQFITGYEGIIEKYRTELPFNIYSCIIKNTTQKKLQALRQFVSNC